MEQLALLFFRRHDKIFVGVFAKVHRRLLFSEQRIWTMTASFILNSTAKTAWHRCHRQFGWMALGVLVSGSSIPSDLVSCEDGDKPSNRSIWDTILPKNQDGNVSWDKAGRQVGDQLFWDNIAKSTGAKVRLLVAIIFLEWHSTERFIACALATTALPRSQLRG